jgi:hypothetical protein
LSLPANTYYIPDALPLIKLESKILKLELEASKYISAGQISNV